MKANIDCLLIGSYNFEIGKMEKILKTIGPESSVSRNFNIRYLKHNGKPYEIFELIEYLHNNYKSEKLVNLDETLSNTIAYLGSYLDNHGFSFDYIISFLKEKEKLADLLQNSNVLTIAILTTTYGNQFPIRDLVSFIRKYNTEVKIIIGGPYLNSQLLFEETKSAKIAFLKSLGADFYVDSPQGEDTLGDLLTAIKNNTSFDNIYNLYYKQDGDLIQTSSKDERVTLEENMINWQLFKKDLPDYLFIRTSLSCPFSCSFCDFPARMGKHTYLSLDYVERELDSIAEIGKVKYIRFIDDTLNIPKPRYKEMLKLMIRKKYNFKWNAFYRCQFSDEETVQLMKESGCELVHLGIESGSQQILDNMHKQAKVKDFRKGVDLLNKYGIMSIATLIMGFPGETDYTIKETIDFLNQSPPTFSNFHLWFCSPMTPIWQEKEKYGLSGWAFNWKHNTMDSNRAMDEIEKILINNPLTTSILNTMLAEYVLVFLHNGYSLDQLRMYFNSFNDGVKEKLISRKNVDVSNEVLERIKSSLIQI
ncbi:MAG: radical SAM protein [Bacteroidales bacterium]|nr:radical SAM protein [Bacteroidales bacterium]